MLIRALLLSAILAGCGTEIARADIISASPTFPPNGAAFVGVGAGCFPLAGICSGSGTLRMTSSVSTFSSSGQDIMADVTMSAPVSNLFGTPLGTFVLTGTMEMGLSGRTGADQTGIWSTEIDALELEGTFKGMPVDVGLDASHLSDGTTGISPENQGFRVASFFDLFVDLQLGSLTTERGPILGTLVAVPEPATLAVLCLPLAVLGIVRRRGARPEEPHLS